LRIKKELLLFSVGIIGINSFLFGFAVFILSRTKGIGDFEYAIIATLFLLTTTASIYLAHSLTELFYAPIKNFRLLIEDTMHEINTPVATIKTNTSMLKKTADEAELKKLSRIELACSKLLDLYENLEYFAKKEAKLNQKTVFDAKEAIEAEIALIEDAFLKKGVTLSAKLESRNLFIDKKGFSLALANLLSNALKFTKSGAVEITFQDGVLNVKDSGCGIAEDELIKIFDRYYQESGSDSGRGIGLFLVKEFCDENGVELFIRSEVGSGSEFTLDFGKIRKKF
jgi:signal transduction histidine kinase